jgi:microcystin-dependent protein
MVEGTGSPQVAKARSTAFAFGFNASTNTLTVNNLGVGINPPSARFDTAPYSDSTINTILARGADGAFQLSTQNGPNNNASGQEVSRIGVNYSGVGWNSYLRFIRGAGATDGSVTLHTNDLERIRVNSSGRVGVGTDNLTGGLLNLFSGTGGQNCLIQFKSSSLQPWPFISFFSNTTLFGGAGSGPSLIAFPSSPAATDFAIRYENNLLFSKGSAEVARIDSLGYVGINTITPSQPLDVNGNVRIRSALFDSNNSSGTSGSILTSTVSGIQWAAAAPTPTSSTPIGTIIWFSVNSAPTDYIACNGASTLNTYTYRLLHAVISNLYGGTAYSAGVTDIPSATTTFTIPDLRDRVPVGSGSSYNVSNNGGSNTTTLTVANLPPHNHAYSQFNHSHGSNLLNFAGQNGVPGSAFGLTTPGQVQFSSSTGGAGANITISTNTTSNQMASTAVDIRQPYLALLPCIKYQ